VAADERDKVRAAMVDFPLNGLTFMVAGYEGHEFLLVRLLIEAGAKVPYLSTAVNTNAGAPGRAVVARARVHGAVRREFRR
jgi:chlorophyllide a reductase subunit Y